jgi:hypothetical protein
MTHLIETQRTEIFILIGCWDKTKTGGISIFPVYGMFLISTNVSIKNPMPNTEKN